MKSITVFALYKFTKERRYAVLDTTRWGFHYMRYHSEIVTPGMTIAALVPFFRAQGIDAIPYTFLSFGEAESEPEPQPRPITFEHNSYDGYYSSEHESEDSDEEYINISVEGLALPVEADSEQRMFRMIDTLEQIAHGFSDHHCDDCVMHISSKYCASCGTAIKGMWFTQPMILDAIRRRIKEICRPGRQDIMAETMQHELIKDNIFTVGSKDDQAALIGMMPNLYEFSIWLRDHCRCVNNDLITLPYDQLLETLVDKLGEAVFVYGGRHPIVLSTKQLMEHFPDIDRSELYEYPTMDGYKRIYCLMKVLSMLDLRAY